MVKNEKITNSLTKNKTKTKKWWKLKRSVLSARVPKCQNIKNGGFDQYDAERFGRLIFAAIRKSVGLNRVI